MSLLLLGGGFSERTGRYDARQFAVSSLLRSESRRSPVRVCAPCARACTTCGADVAPNGELARAPLIGALIAKKAAETIRKLWMWRCFI